MIPNQLIAACWIFFLLYWMISARSIKRAAERQPFPSILAHRLPLWAGILLLFVPRTGPLGQPIASHPEITRWLGAALCVFGVLGAVWSRRILADNWSNNVEFKQGHQLVERGPYRFIRHPIYSTMLLMFLGTALAGNRLGALAGLVCFFIAFLIKLKQEERLLTRHFPDEYPAYKARTKMLVPFLF